MINYLVLIVFVVRTCRADGDIVFYSCERFVDSNNLTAKDTFNQYNEEEDRYCFVFNVKLNRHYDCISSGSINCICEMDAIMESVINPEYVMSHNESIVIFYYRYGEQISCQPELFQTTYRSFNSMFPTRNLVSEVAVNAKDLEESDFVYFTDIGVGGFAFSINPSVKNQISEISFDQYYKVFYDNTKNTVVWDVENASNHHNIPQPDIKMNVQIKQLKRWKTFNTTNIKISVTPANAVDKIFFFQRKNNAVFVPKYTALPRPTFCYLKVVETNLTITTDCQSPFTLFNVEGDRTFHYIYTDQFNYVMCEGTFSLINKLKSRDIKQVVVKNIVPVFCSDKNGTCEFGRPRDLEIAYLDIESYETTETDPKKEYHYTYIFVVNGIMIGVGVVLLILASVYTVVFRKEKF